MQIILHDVVKGETDPIKDTKGNDVGKRFVFTDSQGRISEIAVFHVKQEQPKVA